MKRETIRGDEAGRSRSTPAEAGDAGKAPRLRLDLSLKQMFMIGAIVADFLLTCQPEQACLLKLTTLRRLSAEHIGPGLELRIGDTVWRAELRDVDGQLGYVIVEFQTRVDRTMPERMVRYKRGTRRAARVESAGESDLVGPVLPVVLYTGKARWTASRHVKGERSSKFAADYRPLAQYELVDLARSECDDLDGTSVFAVVQKIHCAELEEVLPLLRELLRRASAKGGAAACVAAGEFVVELLRPLGMTEKLRAVIAEAAKGDGEMPEGVMLELEEDMPRWYESLIERGRAEGAKEGRAEGERRGRAAMLLRFAERKFGPEAAEQLADIVTSDVGLDRLGDWIIDCGSLDELMAQVENGAP